MKIYLAGPMTGYPDLNFPAFMAAAEHLRTLGHEVVNPAELNPDPSAKWHDCMKVDIRELLTCEAIATLPGFEKSKGASLEFHIAAELEFTHIPMTGETMKGEINYYVSGTVSKLVAAVTVLLMFCVTATAQTFPRWPDNQTVRIYTLQGAFTDKEQSRIKAAVEAWRPLLPAGMTMTIAGEASHVEECQGCVTLNRESVIKSRWAECESHTNDKGLTKWVVIRIDPRAGSGDKFQRRVEHEIGHVLGLDHRPDSIMTERPHGKPGEGDAAILRTLYGPQPSFSFGSQPEGYAFIRHHWVHVGAPQNRGPALNTNTLAQQEAANSEALKSHQWTLTVSIQTLDEDGKANGDYGRISHVVLDDQGHRYEKVLSKHSHLKGMRITKADEIDFLGPQMGLIDFTNSRFTQGTNGAIHVEPVSLDKRGYSGDIWVGEKGIEKFIGTTLPEGSERFPMFTATRTLIDGHLFPSKMFAKGVFNFHGHGVFYSWSVEASEYRKFGSQMTVKEIEEQ